jgi:hypothetical protein
LRVILRPQPKDLGPPEGAVRENEILPDVRMTTDTDVELG